MKKQRLPDGARPTGRRAADRKAVGFWNSLPVEEERGPLPLMEPHYRNKGPAPDLRPLAWINVRELTIFLSITYSAAAFARVALIFIHWH